MNMERPSFRTRRSVGANNVTARATLLQREEVPMDAQDATTSEELADRIWAALTSHDVSVLESHLAEDARWESCVGRSQVIEYMSGVTSELDLEVEELVAYPRPDRARAPGFESA
jgi:hypothetical protein